MARTEIQQRITAVSESAVDYVAEILEREAEGGQKPPTPRRRSRLPTLLGLLATVLALTTWNVARAVRTPEVFSTEQEDAAARFHVYLLVQDIEAYRDSAGVVPPGLDVLGQEEEGITYTPERDGYVLTAIIEGEPVEYRSGESLEPFVSAYDELTGRE